MVIQPLSTCLIKPNFRFDLSHRRSTTVSLETRNPLKPYLPHPNLFYTVQFFLQLVLQRIAESQFKALQKEKRTLLVVCWIVNNAFEQFF